jgi:hypothetical protein
MSARAYRPRLRTDWFRVLVDLQYAGYPHARVAQILDVPVATLRGWKAGSEPAHNYGHALLELWTEVMQQGLTQRPMTCD